LPRMANFFGQQLSQLVHSLFEPLRQLDLDFAEYVLLKAILLFREEVTPNKRGKTKWPFRFAKQVGLSTQGMAQVREARTRYLRALFKYIRDTKRGMNTGNAGAAFERMSSILAMASLISTLKSVANERVQISSIFNLIEFDSLIKDVHSSDLDA